MCIPHEYPLIPPYTSNPPTSSKQTPVHARYKLRMPIHQPQLHPLPHRRHLRPRRRRRHGTPIRPHPHRHIVTRRNQHVSRMRTPRYPPDRVLVASQQRHGPARRIPHVKGADHPVDARGSDQRVVVLVPVVGQYLGRREGGEGLTVGHECARGGRGVYWYCRGQMVFC